MKVTIATTTGFHLRRLALHLYSSGIDVKYYTTMPKFRIKRDGLNTTYTTSLFWQLAPVAGLALMRQLPHSVQRRAVEHTLVATDNHLAHSLKPSTIFVGLSAMAVRSAEVARKQGATVVIDRGARHVLSQHELLTANGGKGLTSGYIARELASYAAADYITVPSEHAAQSFVDRGFDSRRIFVAPLGVDLSIFTPTPHPPGPPKLLFVGGWTHQKGVDVLTEVMRRRPNWSLTHVGTIGDAPPPTAPNIKSIGHLDHQRLAALMATHHLLVLPSRQDGFGMVLLEALASGLPVVASTMTGAPDIKRIISNAQYVGLAQPDDADDLLRSIEDMLSVESNIPTDRSILTAADREALSWRSYGERYRTFLESLPRSHGQQRSNVTAGS